MNKAVVSLGASTAILAAATLYLAWQVSQERGGSRSNETQTTAALSANGGRTGASTATASMKDSTTDSRASATASGAASASTSGSTAQASVKQLKINGPEVYQRLQDEEMMASRTDPVLRRQLIEERIPVVRDQYLQLQRKLKVDPERWQRFMELLAMQDLGYFDAMLDCKKLRACEQPSFDEQYYARQKQDLIDVLGDTHAAEVEKFRWSSTERSGVRHMQTELADDAQLPEQQAEELIDALSQVRMDVEKEMGQRDLNVGRYYQVGGALLYDKSLPTVEARIEDATKYSERLRTRAAKLLRGSQLAAFNRQQDRLLELFKEAQGLELKPKM